jgi:hypothetical protein
MRYRSLFCRLVAVDLWLILSMACAHAGSFLSLKDDSATSGKITLTPAALHVETGATPLDVPLDSILEADFSDQPFHIDYFSSALTPNQLPASWKGQDVGKHPPGKDGSYTYKDGVLTLTGTGFDLQRGGNEDQHYIMGQIWSGGGQLTARLRGMDPNPGGTMAGPMLRIGTPKGTPPPPGMPAPPPGVGETPTDPLAVMTIMGMRGGDGGGLFYGRGNPGDHVSWTGVPADFPTWFRVTWSGASLDYETAKDGRKWSAVGENGIKNTDNIWVGLAVNSGKEDTLGSAMFDQILLKPPAAEPGTLPNGVLFADGTYVFGGIDFMSPNGGQMSHAGKGFPVAFKQVAALIAHPLTVQQRTDNLAALPGLLFKNSDFIASDLDGAQGSGYYQISSIAFGAATYYGDTARAYLVQKVKPVPSKYEVRLHDGSILQAKDMAADGSQLVITDVSGLAIHIDPTEVAQFRAGSAEVQNLINLAWKTSASSGDATPPAAGKPDDKTGPASGATNAAPAATPPPPPADALIPPDANSFSAPPTPASETWEGPGQEQMIVLSAGNKIDFPLGDKFRSLVMRVALSPDSPAGAQANFHILVDGKEAGGTPVLKSGDAPQLVALQFQDPKVITLSVDSTTPGARVLFIDPVAVRDAGTP